jgi:ribosomal protein L3 glutamine methyltransferase
LPKRRRPRAAARSRADLERQQGLASGSAAQLETILDYVRYAVTQFAAAGLVFAHGTTDPVAEGAFLVCAALQLAPDQFETFATARLAQHEREQVLDLIAARIRTRKPAAYLVRKAFMRDVPFYVDERAIVPRSFIGEILDDDNFTGAAHSLLPEPGAIARVLDLCTGSGCLAILAAMRFPNAMVDAVDISADALAVAARNVADHCLDARITLHQGDLFAPLAAERYDLIISNPPYVDAAGMASLPPECRHEPAIALDGGTDGIAIVRRIIDNAGRHLTRNAGLLCEVGRDRPILEATYPDAGFLWLDTEDSRGEVFWLEAAHLT